MTITEKAQLQQVLVAMETAIKKGKEKNIDIDHLIGFFNGVCEISISVIKNMIEAEHEEKNKKLISNMIKKINDNKELSQA